MNNPYTNPFAPAQPAVPSVISGVGSFFKRGIYTVFGLAVLLLVGYLLYKRFRSGGPSVGSWGTSAKDQTPTPVDAMKGTTIPAGDITLGDTSDYGVQYWMYIKDWNYGFGKEKGVILRTDSANKSVMNPNITLHPTDNSLNVAVSLYPSNASVGASSPAPSNDTSSTGDVFTCTVENVPLQAWFSVSATVFQRNIDIYINGRLVKSCVLPGIPKIAAGDMVIGANGGFSGSVCNVHYYPRMLTPGDAMTFYSAGTSCSGTVTTSTPQDTGSTFSLFGYRFSFSVKDQKGDEVRNYSF